MKHPYEPFLHPLKKPSQYLGGEYRRIRKDWEKTPIRVALAFPDAYEVGMSHLGLKILYHYLNADPRIAAERVFAPWPDLEAELRAHGVPLVTLENHKPLAAFDVIGFSLQYELTFTNILNMLDLSGLPLRSAERDSNEWPLVVAGGPVATQPEPLAPFIDCFVIGDGEYYFQRLIHTYVELREKGLSRRDILVRLAQLGGVYCPSLYATREDDLTGLVVVGEPLYEGVPARVERRIVEDINQYPFPADTLVPSTEVVFDRFSVEIARGCTEGCRFCQAGMIYRPVRERDPDQIIDTVLEAVRKGGYDETALTSLSTADFSCVSPLVKKLMGRLREEKVALSVSSLRAYGLPEDLLEAISDVRNTSLTFAPEAGTQRMRDVVNKNISEEDMERAAHAVFSRGWKRCKLYFMIGLPTEEDDDVLGIARTAKMYLDIARRYHRGRAAEITVSVSTHVPKPHTPFQWAQMDDLDEIERKQRLLLDAVKGERIRIKFHDRRISHLEGILSRGDRRIADLVEYAFRRGCRFDGWEEHFRFDVWMEGLEELGIDKYRSLRTLPVDARLPWDHIDVGLKPGFLEREYRRALKDRLSPPCGKPLRTKVHHTNLKDAEADNRPLVCFDCGIACDLTKMREERKVFLRKLGALEPPAPPEREETDVQEIRARNRRPRTRIHNERLIRYRLLYEKRGPQRFISHLDLIRLLPRVFRRANVPMAYSLGFHPKPQMTFAPALPLGWAGHREALDMTLTVSMDPAELIRRLNEVSPPGVRFLGARELSDGDAALSRVIQAGLYQIALPAGADRNRIRRVLEEWREGGAVILAADGEREALDVTAGIAGMEFLPPGTPPRAEPDEYAGGGDGGHCLFLLRLDRAPAVRADRLAHHVTGSWVRPQQVARVALGWLEGGDLVSPLELERLRELRRRAREEAGALASQARGGT